MAEDISIYPLGWYPLSRNLNLSSWRMFQFVSSMEEYVASLMWGYFVSFLWGHFGYFMWKFFVFFVWGYFSKAISFALLHKAKLETKKNLFKTNYPSFNPTRYQYYNLFLNPSLIHTLRGHESKFYTSWIFQIPFLMNYYSKTAR